MWWSCRTLRRREQRRAEQSRLRPSRSIDGTHRSQGESFPAGRRRRRRLMARRIGVQSNCAGVPEPCVSRHCVRGELVRGGSDARVPVRPWQGAEEQARVWSRSRRIGRSVRPTMRKFARRPAGSPAATASRGRVAAGGRGTPLPRRRRSPPESTRALGSHARPLQPPPHRQELRDR